MLFRSYDPTDVANLISSSSAFSKLSFNIWKFLIHITLKSPSRRILSITLLVCEMSVIIQFFVIHTKALVNKAEVDVFLESPCFFYDPMDVGNLIPVSSAFSKSSVYIWKFLVHVLVKPSLEDFEHYFASM